MMRSLLRTIWLLLATVLLFSCTADTTCRQDMGVWMGIGFRADSLKQVADTLPLERVEVKQIKGMQIMGVGRDSLLLDETQSVQTLYVPLRKDADECAFRICYRGLCDTLTLHYDRDVQFISLACGCAVMATLTDAGVGGSLLDSAVLVNQAVTTKKETHVLLYFHIPQ